MDLSEETSTLDKDTNKISWNTEKSEGEQRDYNLDAQEILRIPEVDKIKKIEKVFMIEKDLKRKKDIHKPSVINKLPVPLKNTLKPRRVTRNSGRRVNKMKRLSDNTIFIEQRRDLAFKSSLRLLRKFFKDRFKSDNIDVVRRRYVNCGTEILFQRMHLTLQKIFEEDSLPSDLVYFTLGMISIKKPEHIQCCRAVKHQIQQFNGLTQKFSQKGFEKCLNNSPNLQKLLYHFLENCDSTRINILREEITSKLD